MSSDETAAGSGGMVLPPVGGESAATGDTAVDEDAPVAPVPLLAAVCHRHPPWRQEPYEILRPMGEDVWLAERTCTSRAKHHADLGAKGMYLDKTGGDRPLRRLC